MNQAHVLLQHSLKQLKLPAFLRDYQTMAEQCRTDRSDYPAYLLRRASSGEALRVIGGTLNQSIMSVMERYAYLADDPLRQAFERHGENIISIQRVKEKKGVV